MASHAFWSGRLPRPVIAIANLDNGDPETLLFSITRFFKFLPEEQQQVFLQSLSERTA
jgi:hypothetical protein